MRKKMLIAVLVASVTAAIVVPLEAGGDVTSTSPDSATVSALCTRLHEALKVLPTNLPPGETVMPFVSQSLADAMRATGDSVFVNVADTLTQSTPAQVMGKLGASVGECQRLGH